MRRIAHCLILLLAPLAAHAADAFDTPARSNACTYAPDEVERVAAPAAAVNITNTPPPSPKQVTPPTPPQQAGGGSDDEVIPRMRAPKWHRLLPGMFR